MDRRLAEAARLGFTTALVPVGCGTVPKGLRALECATIGDALRAMLAVAELPTAPSPFGGIGATLRQRARHDGQ